MKFVAKDQSDPKMVRAAEVATALMNQPGVQAEIEREVTEEFRKELTRQMVFGLAPSEGLSDMRPHHPRWRGRA